MIRSSLSLFAWHGQVGMVQTVIHPDDRANYEAAAAGLKLLPPVAGGASRQASVRAGLEALSARAPDIVLVHDAARPFCSTELVSRAITACEKTGAAIPALEVTDTIKRVDAGRPCRGHGRPRASFARCRRRRPSRFDALLAAHRKAAAAGREDFTDDAALIEWAGHKVAVFAGESGNVKLTTEEDFAKAEARRIASLTDLRLGNGFDVHAFGDGDHVWLGGLKIPHDRGLTGHSDADVALHAIVDAILGAIADGDIGKHFSPNDPRWKGASSDQFLKFAVERVDQARRPGRAYRRDDRLRGAAHRPAPRRNAKAHRRDCRHRGGARGGEGHDQRGARLHRPQGRHRRDGDGDRPPALDLVTGFFRWPTRRRRPRQSRCSISARPGS